MAWEKSSKMLWDHEPAAPVLSVYINAFCDTKMPEIGSYRIFAAELLGGRWLDEPRGKNIQGLEPLSPP